MGGHWAGRRKSWYVFQAQLLPSDRDAQKTQAHTPNMAINVTMTCSSSNGVYCSAAPRARLYSQWNQKYKTCAAFLLLAPYFHLGYPLVAMSESEFTKPKMSRRESDLLSVREERKANAFPFSL